MHIPIARTSLSQEEIESVLEPLHSGWLVQGPRVAEFEEKWSLFTGAKNSVAVTSCTSALHLSLAALGIGPGDEVIVPAFTWISTANVVEHLGATVVFVDVDVRNFNIDPSQIESKITSKTKAIMPVHLFGFPADMNAILSKAKEHDLKVIEDAACGFGSTYFGSHVGTLGDFGCFSFHPRKSITTGEGGMITTNNEKLAAATRRLRDHGASMSDLQRHLGPKPYLLPEFPDAGYNQRMTDIQGALGSSQMNRAAEILQERKRLALRYDEAFVDLPWLATPPKQDNYEHSYQSYACLFEPELLNRALDERDVLAIGKISLSRDDWMDELQKAGISTRPATHAVHMLGYYARKYAHKPEDFLGAMAADRCSISLPLFHGMTEAEQDYVIYQVQSKAI
jgi:dTDP-4-amino-4,6-dideoxygalactose transaminase